MTVIPDRLAAVASITLDSGAHDSFEDGACLLEAVAYVAGETFSDHPACVDPVLAAFGRTWNDALNDETRNRILKPFIPRLIGTADGPKIQDRRAFMAADWAVRVFTPTWLRLAGLAEDAAALDALPEVSTVELCQAAMPVIGRAGAAALAAAGDTARAAARDAAGDAAWNAAMRAALAAAWDAAWNAARDAAGDAAWNAARAAAGDAAWDAARNAAWNAARAAAWNAAGDAAWNAAMRAAGAAARDAAWDAAWNAAWDALAPTVAALQASAADLFNRMIQLTENQETAR